jgi:hypothetical protein
MINLNKGDFFSEGFGRKMAWLPFKIEIEKSLTK